MTTGGRIHRHARGGLGRVLLLFFLSFASSTALASGWVLSPRFVFLFRRLIFEVTAFVTAVTIGIAYGAAVNVDATPFWTVIYLIKSNLWVDASS